MFSLSLSFLTKKKDASLHLLFIICASPLTLIDFILSQFQFVPAACVFGSSWTDWHRIFFRTKQNESTDYMICLPAYGAVYWSVVWCLANGT
ncbi:hypothetical protein P3L10_030512 [Capsicum annuum]